jgi:hypothetical protein
VSFDGGVISEAGATLRVARLERLLERVRMNTARPRSARQSRAVSAPPASLRSDDPEIDYEDFADAEMVEITVDEPSIVPSVQPRASASPTAYSMSFVDDGLPAGISPLTEGGEALVAGVVSTNPPALFGEEHSELSLHSPHHSEPPTWHADAAQPTMEQLGNTIGLESSLHGPELELDVQSEHPTHDHELEVTLPTRGFAGGYDEGLLPPETAQQDLAQYSGTASSSDAFGDVAFEGAFGGGTFGVQSTEPMAAAVAPAAVHSTEANRQRPQGAHVVQRAELSPTVPVAEIVDNRQLSAQSFVALLDESISLSDR